MTRDVLDGLELITEIIQRRREDQLSDIYYFAQFNSYQRNHATLQEWLDHNTVNQQAASIGEPQKADDILAGVRETLKSFSAVK